MKSIYKALNINKSETNHKGEIRMSKKEDAIAKSESGAMMPAFLPKEGDHRGTEHMTKEDITMPRIGLAQGLSPQVDDTSSKFIEDLKVGDMFNNVTNEIIGKGPIFFTVVKADRPRGVEFYPLTEGGGVKDINVSLDDPRMQFTGDGNKPVATKFYDYIIMIVPTRELIALSFKGTGLKVARQLNALMKLRNQASFAGRYSLKTASETNKLGKFAVFQVANAGWIVNEDEFNYAQAVYENIKDKVVVIEREGDDNPEVNTDTVVGADGKREKVPF